jgi:hypothetical protein
LVLIEPPTLTSFKQSEAFVRCIKGPVGSGKSSQCVKEILRRAAKQVPGPDGVRRSRFAVIRNTYRELKDTTRKTFEEWIPHEIGRWLEQDFTFRAKCALDTGPMETEILFRALDRPDDVKKLLSLELTGAYINEAREIPKHVLDVLETRVGRYPSRGNGGCTWSGIWMDTNPWHAQHWGAKLFRRQLPGYELFEQPGGRSLEAENVENLPAGYYQRLCVGKDSEWIRVYVDGEDASAAPGSVYGRLIEALRKRKGIGVFDHPADGVFTSWDLGYSDSTAIWFWRLNEHRAPDLIDHAESHGTKMSEWFDLVEAKPYQYVKHYMPHDARNKSWQTGLSVLEQTISRWPGKLQIVPQNDVEDGIAAARWLLEQPMRVHSRCAEALETLAAYRYEWDEESQTFGVRPVHDFASHTADAFRYLACVVKHSELITRKATPVKPAEQRGHDGTWTLDKLFADNEADKHGRRRI